MIKEKPMNMTNMKPTVVLVHGAFAESASWDGVIQQLQAQSFDVVAVANPLRGLVRDAAYVKDVIAAIGKPVVLVGHSYGGMVITEAAANNTRVVSAPSTSRVVALVYVAAFAPEHGENATELSGRYPGSSLGEALTDFPNPSGGNDLVIRQEVFHDQFAADVPAAQAALMAATQRPVTDLALSEGLPSSSPAWANIPSWFVIPDQDRNIPPALQRFQAQRAGASGTRVVVGASHAVSVSNPDAVAKVILEAVATVERLDTVPA
jgi:pimeloyl-ACP methyl ester carboxylesterase